ncbi:dehydratase [Planctomycetota bacterium]|nr:dehydratase [Planctomycetota bacterium]
MTADLIIDRIETIRVPEHPNTLWVQVHAGGLIGLGETYYLPGAVESVIHDLAAPLLLGQRAYDRERLWADVFAHANFFGHAGAELRGLSALDIALWDLVGQRLGVPIHDLIGGKCRDTIPVYATCANTPLYDDQTASLNRAGELAESLLAEGFTQMKLWPWDRFAPQRQPRGHTGPAGWSAVGQPGHRLTAADLASGLEPVRAIRAKVGDRMAIAIEGHSRWDLNSALTIARAVEPFGVVWMEDMIQPTSAADLARFARESRVPQAVSERLFTRWAFREVFEREAAHIAMFDLIWTGGITESIKICALADTYHLPFAPHDCTGPVNVLACLHLCAALPNAMIMEVVRGFVRGYYLDILDRPIVIRDGQAVLDFAPGLGAKLHPKLLARSDLARRVSVA